MTDETQNFNQFPLTTEEKSNPVISAELNNNVEEKNSEKKKSAKKNKDDLGDLKIIENPVRNLPKLINEVLEKNFSVILTKNGYYISGFYGLNQENGKKGFAFGQETTNPEVLVFFDSKGHKHLIKSFEDLVNFNNHVWGLFFKLSEEYKKPNSEWFHYLLDLGVLNITPGGR